jgi:hypothetical protein
MVEAMVNELEEFRAYTEFPVYKADSKRDTSYMGRFTLPMLLDFTGFQRILTILVRGYLFRDGGSGYARIEVARRALLAWCSLSTETMKKAPDQNDPRLRVNYGKYADEFPELVTPDGEGWLIRHVENIAAFVEANPDDVRKEVVAKAQALKVGFRAQWAKKVQQMLIPSFASNTKGAWVLRFDDILADALELGPLKSKDFELSEDVLQRLAERTSKGVPVEASVMLYKYYVANREEGRDYVVLPNQNFNAFFGTTAFSQKWVAVLNGKVIEKKYSEGVCKYRIVNFS